MIWPSSCTPAGSISVPPKAGCSPAQNPGLPSPSQARMKAPLPNPGSPWSSLKTLILQPCCRFRGLHPQV